VGVRQIRGEIVAATAQALPSASHALRALTRVRAVSGNAPLLLWSLRVSVGVCQKAGEVMEGGLR